MRRNLWVVVSLAALLLASPCAPGAVKNFITDGGTWNTAANWADSITGLPGVPGAADYASFNTSSGSSCVLNAGVNALGLDFATAGSFALSYPTTAQTVHLYAGGITVNPAAPATVSINNGSYFYVDADQTWNVAGGSLLVVGTSANGQLFWGQNKTITKTGDGTVNLWMRDDTNAPFLLHLNSGTFAFNNTTGAYLDGVGVIQLLDGSGNLQINAGATQMLRLYGTTSTTFYGSITGTSPLEKLASNTFTLAGTSSISAPLWMHGGTVSTVTSGTISHFTGGGLAMTAGTLLINGASDADTVEQGGFLRVGSWGPIGGNGTDFYEMGIGTINLQHGAGHNLTLTLSNTTNWLGNTNQKYCMVRFTGNDFGATSGNYSQVVVAGTTNVNVGGILGGYIYVTDPTGAKEADFASADATGLVTSLTTVGRPGDPNTSGAANVLMTAGTALSAAKAVNSLKISGNQGLDLGGFQLTVNRGGIIQTGTSNVTGITNGTIGAVGSAPYGLYIYTEKDLVISATVNIGGSAAIIKGGPGKLTYSGSAWVGQKVLNFVEGSLDWQSNVTPVVYGTQRMDSPSQANLTLSSSIVLRFQYGWLNLSGTAEVKAGTLRLDPDASIRANSNNSSMNAGALQVNAGGTLWLSDGNAGTNKYFGADTVTGTGTLVVNSLVTGLGTSRTLLAAGCSFQPGYGFATPGVQTIAGGLSLTLKDAKYASLVTNLLNGASGAPVAGTDYNQLVVTGTVTNLPNADLVVHLASGQHWGGATMTILTAGGGFAGTGTKQFRSVTFDPYYSGTVNYGANAITLSNIVPLSGLAATPVSGGLISLGTNIASGTPVTDANAVSLSSIGGSFSTLNITDVQVTGADAALFSAVLNGSGTGIAQGTNVYYDLAFAGTTAAGTYSASLLFTTDAGYGPSTASYSLEATVVAAADIPGDINRDNIVDQADYTVWYNHYGQTPATWTDGDVTGDNIVDQADYTVWYNNYGSTGGNVPEPMTMALLAIGGLAMLRRRK